MNSRERVEALGRELLSYLPQARQPSSLLASTSGPAPSSRIPCPGCQARGRVRAPGVPCVHCQPRRAPSRGAPPWNTPHGCKPCLACEGTGWRKARAGEEPVDEYLGTAQDARKTWEEAQDLQARLERTNRLLALWLEPDTIGFGWEERKLALWASGSFAELDAALRRLQPVQPARTSLWIRVIVLAEPVRLASNLLAANSETSELLASMMPRPIRVPAWLRPERKAKLRKTSLWRGRTNSHTGQREERDALIRHQADDLGWSPSKIAAYHGLTKRRVNQILAKEVAA